MVGRVEIEEAHRPVILTEQLFKVLVLNDHLGQPAVGLLDERKVAPHIVGLAAETGQARSVRIADELIEPSGFLYIAGGATAGQRITHKVKVLPCVEYIPKGLHQLLRFFPDAAVQVDQQTVKIVVDLEVVAGRLVEEDPASAAEDFDVPLIIDREQGHDEFPQRLLAADPGHETVQGVSPPSSGRRVCAVSSCSRDRFSPRIAAAIPPIRLVRWAMVERTSWSVAAK